MWGFNKYGWYFGPHWRDGDPPTGFELDNWLVAFDDNLVHWLTDLRIDLVRIFLLCNLQNFGNARGPSNRWALPSSLDPLFLDHLNRMLAIARNRNVQLIPSLVDFGIADPHSPARPEGRSAIINDVATMTRFYDMTLRPFLQLSASYRDVIYAWEVMNEPSWLSSYFWPGHIIPDVAPPTEYPKLVAFLSYGLKMIEQHGFQSTVGHRHLHDLSAFPNGTIRQFHYYARALADPAAIPPHVVDEQGRIMIVGEFSVVDGDQGSPWPSLQGADISGPRARVRERLLALERLGYPVALIWPEGVAFSIDPPVTDRKIGPEVEAGILDFWSSGEPT